MRSLLRGRGRGYHAVDDQSGAVLTDKGPRAYFQLGGVFKQPQYVTAEYPGRRPQQIP